MPLLKLKLILAVIYVSYHWTNHTQNSHSNIVLHILVDGHAIGLHLKHFGISRTYYWDQTGPGVYALMILLTLIQLAHSLHSATVALRVSV